MKREITPKAKRGEKAFLASVSVHSVIVLCAMFLFIGFFIGSGGNVTNSTSCLAHTEYKPSADDFCKAITNRADAIYVDQWDKKYCYYDFKLGFESSDGTINENERGTQMNTTVFYKTTATKRLQLNATILARSTVKDCLKQCGGYSFDGTHGTPIDCTNSPLNESSEGIINCIDISIQNITSLVNSPLLDIESEWYVEQRWYQEHPSWNKNFS